MKHYILYDSTTGFISTQLSMTDRSLQKTLANNPNLSALIGRVPNVNTYQMNVSTDPHTIESKPEETINVSAYIRELRTKLLKASDWTQAADSPLTDAKKTEWATYRQALRDMPDTCSDCATVDDVTWPTKPGA
jgi:hypothetical protein